MKSRRRIAFPKAQDNADYKRDLRLAKWAMIYLRCKIPELRMSGMGH